MLKKPLAIAAIATALAGTLLPTTAAASGDPGLGALIGGVIGAAIGHDINGRHGALVGGVLGAMTGASIAAGPRDYYGPGYGAPAGTYYPPQPVYYAPRPYYRPAPVYYAPPPVIIRPRPVFVRNVGPMRPSYAPGVVVRRHDDRHYGNDYRPTHDRRWR